MKRIELIVDYIMLTLVLLVLGVMIFRRGGSLELIQTWVMIIAIYVIRNSIDKNKTT